MFARSVDVQYCLRGKYESQENFRLSLEDVAGVWGLL